MTPARRVAAARAGLVALVAALTFGAAVPAVGADELPPPVRVGGDVELEVTVPDIGQDDGDDDDPATGAAELTDAELRWGINHETLGASLDGNCNFLMAGMPGTTGNTGGGEPWTEADKGLYRARQGHVEIRVPTADREDERLATFATRCQDPEGNRLTTTARNLSEAEVVVDGGVGERQADGSVEIAWDGTFSVVFYGGRTYWWASDPRLELDENGNGTLVATVGGYGSDMNDMTRWVRLKEREVELATFVDGRLTGKGGELTPRWSGVRLGDLAGTEQKFVAAGDVPWGSFPTSFVAFQVETGQAAYWYTSGSSRDAYKKPYPVTVSFDARNSLGPTDRPDTPDPAPPVPAPSPFTPQDLPGDDDASASGSGSGSGTGGTTGTTTPAASGVPATRSLGAPVRAAVPAAGAAPVVFPASAATGTLGLGTEALVPTLTTDERTPGELMPWGVAALALGASVSVVGFRRGWLVLPFT